MIVIDGSTFQILDILAIVNIAWLIVWCLLTLAWAILAYMTESKLNLPLDKSSVLGLTISIIFLIFTAVWKAGQVH